MKHFMIAANSGCDKSLKSVGEGYKEGLVTKDDTQKHYVPAKTPFDEMKSEQRSKVAGKYQGLEALR